MRGDRRVEARTELSRVLAAQLRGIPGASSALAALDAGGAFTLAFTPEVVRPWGDADALQAALDRYALTATTMAAVRVSYQAQLLVLLGNGRRRALARQGPRCDCPIGPSRAGVGRRRSSSSGATSGSAWISRRRSASSRATTRSARPRACCRTRARSSPPARRRSGPRSRTSASCARSGRAGSRPSCARSAATTSCSPRRSPIRRAITWSKRIGPTRSRRKRRRALGRARRSTSTTRGVPIRSTCGSTARRSARSRRAGAARWSPTAASARCACSSPAPRSAAIAAPVRQVYLHDGWSVTMHCPK